MITLTKQQIKRTFSPSTSRYKDLGRALREEFDALPGGDDTSFTPGQMAELGVPHQTIIRAFLRPDVLGDAFGEVVCRLAEAALRAFEMAFPADNRPRAAIEAARRCFADPTEENESIAARASAVAAAAAARAAVVAPGDAEPWDAKPWAAALAASWAADSAADTEWAADEAAAHAARKAVAAGCTRAKIISIIEGAGQ
ncbi:MAG: hypothetical protein GY767_06590 [Shimia sp.]|nr:hypothetical protein [Shimia sp.]